ncbi:MAG: lytic transglycosylase domain-containing protein [Ferruginibacter sp.]|nr:lytic transglycosylase domain-containing protein [Cytophagales bacterium]
MKKVQFVLLLTVMIFLIGYAIYTNLSVTYRFPYAPNDRFQTYLTLTEVPERLYFADEQIPLDNQRVARRLQREMQIHAYFNNSQFGMMQRADYWLPKFDPILKQYGIPRDFRYLAVVESMLLNVESPKGAGGFWQLMPATAKSFGLEINDEVDERYHPIKATHAACKYLRQAQRTLGSWTTVAASYNVGIGGVMGAMRRQNKQSFYDLRLNSETARYLFKVTAYKQLLEHPREYGYRTVRNNPLRKRSKKVRVTESIEDLSAFASEHATTLSQLKRDNPWLLSNRLTIKEAGKSYLLEISDPPPVVEPTEEYPSVDSVFAN